MIKYIPKYFEHCKSNIHDWDKPSERIFNGKVVKGRPTRGFGSTSFNYAGKLYEPSPWTDTMFIIKQDVEKLVWEKLNIDKQFTFCLCGFYGTDGRGIPHHSDTVPTEDDLVVSISLGAPRIFIQKTYQNLEELTSSLDSFSFRVLKKECLDLPDKIYTKREVELTSEQKKVYKELAKYAITELESHETVSVTSILTQILRLHQVVCGFVKHDKGEEVEIKNNRIDELINVLQEIQGKTIIWANYQYDIKRILKTIQGITGTDSVATYYGDTPDEERQEIIRRFQNPDSELQYLISNVQTGGYGITLTEAKNVIYYSNNYDLEKRLQSEDRAHRIGQTNKVTYIDLVAKGTVDEKIVKALRNKLDLAQEVLGDEKWKDWIN